MPCRCLYLNYYIFIRGLKVSTIYSVPPDSKLLKDLTKTLSIILFKNLERFLWTFFSCLESNILKSNLPYLVKHLRWKKYIFHSYLLKGANAILSKTKRIFQNQGMGRRFNPIFLILVEKG